MALIISAPLIGKRRRVECEGNDPRRSAGAESATALSNTLPSRLNDAHESSFGTRLRGQLKRSMLQATSELRLSLTDNTSPVHPKDVIERAQKIASSALEVLNKNYGSSQTNASPRINSFRTSVLINCANTTWTFWMENFNGQWQNKYTHLSTRIFPIPVMTKGSISIDVMHDLFRLYLSERKLLAQFESNPYSSEAQIEDLYKVKALAFGNQSSSAYFPTRAPN